MDQTKDRSAEEIIALERAALERWCRGDPAGFLEISAPDVSYYDPFLADRVDGLPALTRYYESLRGKIFAARHEMVAPQVLRIGEAAVLSFNFNSWGAGGEAYRWHCTEAYRRDGGQWRIVQTHWSLPQANAT